MFLCRRSFLRLAPLATLAGCGGSPSRVVLYCSQDREFADRILTNYRNETGQVVVPKFDTEANKSVGFYREIVAEKSRPRADVFWNNEIVSTIRLAEQGLLQSHASSAASTYPAWTRAGDDTWHAFASRARVLLVNTRIAGADRPRSLFDLTAPRWKSQVVMARPQFGTTATHLACLFEVLGAGPAEQFLEELKANGLHLAPGNKQVAQWVARGRTPLGKPVAVGITDTDDAVIELRESNEVAIVFPDRDTKTARMGTLFLPNTLCILKGCPNPRGAEQLVEYLLSEKVEKQLAEGPSAQIPLNPRVRAQLPSAIETPTTVRPMEVNWTRAAGLWDDVQAFVLRTFATL